MRLINSTNGAALADNVEVASNFIKRLQGLIGVSALNQGEALLLYPCNCIHTFFMKFPIDVLFINKDAAILHTFENMKPFRFSPIIRASYMVVELPAGRLSSTGTAAGNQVRLVTQ